MAQHSLGPTCRYHEPESTPDGQPKLNAQFFYISSVPIDDPLSPVPPVQSETAIAKHQPQPFSNRDNAALEEAWQSFQSIVEPAKDAKIPRAKTQRMVSFPKFTSGSKAKSTIAPEANGPESSLTTGEIKGHSHTPRLVSKGASQEPLKQDSSVQDAALQNTYDKLPKPPATVAADDVSVKDGLLGVMKNLKGNKFPGSESYGNKSITDPIDQTERLELTPKKIEDNQVSMSMSDGPSDMSKVGSSGNETEQTKYQPPPGKPPARTTERNRRKNWFSSDASEADVMLSQGSNPDNKATSPVNTKELEEAERETTPNVKPRRNLSPFRNLLEKHSKDNKQDPGGDHVDDEDPSKKQKHRSKLFNRNKAQGDPAADSDASSSISGRPFARAPSKRELSVNEKHSPADDDPYGEQAEEQSQRISSKFHQAFHPHPKATEPKKRAYVSVGVSKLHLVEIPDLVMKPIYWSPINDQASVIRATWFFKDTMAPVDADLANRLEAGYEDMKPYSDAYKHELDSCIEHGASAELKVVYKLWPEEKQPGRPLTSTGQVSATNQVDGPANDKASLLTSEINAAADHRERRPRGPYATHSVIYIDSKNAQILKPSLLPNESRGRKPLASIRKGRPIGVPVVRGFDRKTWEKLHPAPKMSEKAAAATVGGYLAQSGDATTRDNRASCVVCDAQEDAPQPKHLVLVIHGIGQKLSERVDSYHFTHAINSLRREFNVEVASDDLKSNMQDNLSIMVLPVNWRLNISFEEDANAKMEAPTDNNYGLADITPETLPAVRSLISDVMLDIPYYLSHHKERMTSAVVREANRVYRLWCKNNIDFQKNGKVHLVAHSLGSVMAMDILSQQPTTVSESLDLTKLPVSETMFEFDTKSLFSCGSPSGFFLLLNNARLLPRKGRKPAVEGEDSAAGVGAGPGTYGCMAVDNVFVLQTLFSWYHLTTEKVQHMSQKRSYRIPTECLR